ncbi:hypothetical protein C8R45DRAFT_1097974 [Mycena sanguinolenta]|nr:hypothetical protein C8R45DRAFT_1097974 [Mycena sanguinolenta]
MLGRGYDGRLALADHLSLGAAPRGAPSTASVPVRPRLPAAAAMSNCACCNCFVSSSTSLCAHGELVDERAQTWMAFSHTSLPRRNEGVDDARPLVTISHQIVRDTRWVRWTGDLSDSAAYDTVDSGDALNQNLEGN